MEETGVIGRGGVKGQNKDNEEDRVMIAGTLFGPIREMGGTQHAPRSRAM